MPQTTLDAWLLQHPMNTQARINRAARPGPVTYSYDPEHLRFSAVAIGAEVGWLEVVRHGETYWLDDIEVHPSYRRQGIARAMMQLAVARFRNNFRVPLLGQSSLHRYWLTAEGHTLVIRCSNAGIITHAHTDDTPPSL